eukprot:Gb_22143 [translate_table: standard]
MAAKSLFLSPSPVSMAHHRHSYLSTTPIISTNHKCRPNAIAFPPTKLSNRVPHELNFSAKIGSASVRFLAPPVHGAETSTLQLADDDGKLSAKAVVDGFYVSLNARDLDALSGLLADGCLFHCLLFPHPFQGKQEVLRFLNRLIESMGSGMQFVIDRWTEGDPYSVGILWHLGEYNPLFSSAY